MSLGNDMDQPFREVPKRPLTGEIEYAGGVVVAAAVTELPVLGKRPVIVFHFANPDGTMRTPIALVCDDAQLAKLIPLVTRAVNAARREAGKS